MQKARCVLFALRADVPLESCCVAVAHAKALALVLFSAVQASRRCCLDGLDDEVRGAGNLFPAVNGLPAALRHGAFAAAGARVVVKVVVWWC